MVKVIFLPRYSGTMRSKGFAGTLACNRVCGSGDCKKLLRRDMCKGKLEPEQKPGHHTCISNRYRIGKHDWERANSGEVVDIDLSI